MAPIPRLAAYDGPPLFSYGFRPFFLAGSIWAAIAIGLWLPAYFGEIALPTAFSGLDWHVHEMLYGFLPAMVTGFLLTAIPNWTGRLPLQGRPLIVLAAVWLAGRIAILTSAWTSLGFAAAVDLAFLVLVGLAAGREVVAGGNWRNLKVVGILSVFAIGNLVFHLEASGVIGGHHDHTVGHYGIRIGLGAGVLLIMLIGGRIVPSFTRNWLARENPGRLPVTPNRFDIVATLVAVVSIAAWIALPQAASTAALLALSAALQAIRFARWAGDRTWRDRLVLILHVAYAFVPLGFALNAAAALDLVPASAGLHAWAVGAVGTMSLAVMSRASLGHTGRALVASPAAQLAYLAVVAATLARICAAVRPEWAFEGLHIAAFAWVAAFGLFVAAYFRVLAGPRAAGRP
ncbi:NnrS family protein [Methyloraptor flagellatus]|uniref:NnrS family protein n=1 Tax=Methyloraptor flagellatus TaxID=3162530 RepID=A0AAU7XG09_9HYPH